MALQRGKGLVDLSQVCFLTNSGKMQEKGVLQFRAVETDAQGLKSFLFEQALLHLSVAIRSGMTAGDPGPLGGDLDLFQVQVVLSKLDLNHEIEGNPSLPVKHDLICLAGLHPNETSGLFHSTGPMNLRRMTPLRSIT